MMSSRWTSDSSARVFGVGVSIGAYPMGAVEIERTTKGGTSPPISLSELTQCPGVRAIGCGVHRGFTGPYFALMTHESISPWKPTT